MQSNQIPLTDRWMPAVLRLSAAASVLVLYRLSPWQAVGSVEEGALWVQWLGSISFALLSFWVLAGAITVCLLGMDFVMGAARSWMEQPSSRH